MAHYNTISVFAKHKMKSALNHYKTRESYNGYIKAIASGDCIIALSFGQGANDTPGDTNEGLAAIINDLYQGAKNKPLILAQWEIADVLKGKYNINVACRAARDPNGDYLSTHGVLKQFRSYILNEGPDLSRFIVVAQADHAFRVRWMMQNLGYALPITYGPARPLVGWKEFNCAPLGYSNLSTQPWTHNRYTFLRNELRYYQPEPKQMIQPKPDSKAKPQAEPTANKDSKTCVIL